MSEENLYTVCKIPLRTEPEIAWKKCSGCFWTDYELYKNLYGYKDETK